MTLIPNMGTSNNLLSQSKAVDTYFVNFICIVPSHVARLPAESKKNMIPQSETEIALYRYKTLFIYF